MQTGSGIMGYNEDRWDCCINHYTNYDWDELDMDDYPEVQLSYKVLGWNNRSWDTGTSDPASEGKSWSELTLFEQASADYVCYDGLLWDEEPLPWGNETGSIPPAEMNFTCPSVHYLNWVDLSPARE
jgi:hypothetical protein